MTCHHAMQCYGMTIRLVKWHFFFLPDLKRGCPTTIVIGDIHHICTYYKHQ